MENLQKITKKNAIQLLKDHENILIQSIWRKDLKNVLELINKVYNSMDQNINNNALITYRKVEKIQSNAIKFNTGSWLYFNDFENAYIYKNWLILNKKFEDNENTMIYKLV